MSKTSYIQFLLNSTNEHGVHSPFVYNLITKCFYSTKPIIAEHDKTVLTKRQLVLFYRLFNYLKTARLLVLGQHAENVTENLRIAGESMNMRLWFCSTMARVPGGVDMGVIADDNKENILAFFEQMLPDVNNNTICIIPNIHSTDEMENTWTAIQNHPKVTVTIDTYSLGLVFFRREQVSQHFLIRQSKSLIVDSLLGLRNLYGLLG